MLKSLNLELANELLASPRFIWTLGMVGVGGSVCIHGGNAPTRTAAGTAMLNLPGAPFTPDLNSQATIGALMGLLCSCWGADLYLSHRTTYKGRQEWRIKLLNECSPACPKGFECFMGYGDDAAEAKARAVISAFRGLENI